MPNPNAGPRPSMQKRHFEALAKALAYSKPDPEILRDPAYTYAWLTCVKNIAAVCAQQNPRFDADRFFAACGVTP